MNSLRWTIFNIKSVIKRRNKLIITGVLFFCIYWFMSSNSTAKIRKEVNIFGAEPCKDEDSMAVIQSICSLYESGEIVGDLCEPLCNENLIEFHHCLNFKHGKYVIQVQCSAVCKPHVTVTAVLKMTHFNSSDLHEHLKTIGNDLLTRLHLKETYNTELKSYQITAREISLLVQHLLDSEYGFIPRESQDMLSMLWNDDYGSHFKGTNTNLAFARSFWSVVYQNEYRVSKVFSDWNVFPKIYGSCGPLYLSENAPGLTTFSKIYSLFVPGYPSWKNRAKTAVSILHLVQLMETMEHPLHLCDVKSPHFGITPEDNVRFIDADTVFADETLLRDLGAPSCKDHKDCAFFDCDGWCNKDTGNCTPLRTNNNLQMVCAKIFRGSFLSSYGGLLISPPKEIADKINSLLDSCADDVTGMYKGSIPLRRPDLGMVSKLSEILLDSINMDPAA